MAKSFRGRGPTVYHVSMTGREIYDTLRMLETRAVSEENYQDLRMCVFLAERIRHEAHLVGWDKNNDREEMRVYDPRGLPDNVGREG